MKVTNNRAKSATVFFKVSGKMNKVKLKPFESFDIPILTDVNAVKNNMLIMDFEATKPVSLSAVTTNIVDPWGDKRSVSKTEGLGIEASAATSGNTFSRRKISLASQIKGRFSIKYA